MGEKLNLRQASYEGLQNVKRVEKITSPKYDRLAEEANKRIRKNQLKQAKAYAEAGMYFCKKLPSMQWNAAWRVVFYINDRKPRLLKSVSLAIHLSPDTVFSARAVL